MRFYGLDLNLLVVLDALLAEQNITRAGEKLFLSQPATSAALARLRDYFSDELLIPVGRRMVRTPVGDSLAQPVRDLLIQMRATLQNQGRFIPKEAERTFTFMVSDYVSMVLMSEFSQRLSQVAPLCRIEQFLPSEHAEQQIERGQVDFLLLPEQHITDSHPSQPLFQDRYVCLLDQSHPLDAMDFETYRQLDHVLVRLGDDHRAPMLDDWLFKRFDFERRVAVTTHTFSSIPAFLVGTQRVATVHQRMAALWVNYLPLKILPLPWESPTLTITLQWNRYQQQDPGLAWARQLLIDTASSLASS
ncbi:LysR family transcriptional regulator [Pseudomonas luteola]|uniref:LysR family transcriptional regulator n=1 Tax=Pseudomonas luteola TaxID=47886 RepID=UPI000F79CC63|nr:LysR family transcriptional regulator [Pseudomonas luteola]RRW40425.1 LysR family transcriptional regulator [Pseudomonas luteola]